MYENLSEYSPNSILSELHFNDYFNSIQMYENLSEFRTKSQEISPRIIRPKYGIRN